MTFAGTVAGGVTLISRDQGTKTDILHGHVGLGSEVRLNQTDETNPPKRSFVSFET